MPNPSELARLEEELEVLRFELRFEASTKVQKEALLLQIREIESILGIEGKSYNSNDF